MIPGKGFEMRHNTTVHRCSITLKEIHWKGLYNYILYKYGSIHVNVEIGTWNIMIALEFYVYYK